MTLEQYTIYDLGFNRFLTKQDNNLGIPSSMKSEMLNSNNPLALASGEIAQNLTIIDGFLQSGNFVTGSAGWRIDADGNLEANSGTFRGALTGNSLAIGTNGLHIDTSGNMWWGSSTTYAGATIKVSSAGAVNFTTGTFSGVLQTASTGTRMTINESGNNFLLFYDGTTQVIRIGTSTGVAMRIDDTATTDSGIAMFSSVGGVGFRYENDADNGAVGLYGYRATLSHSGNDGTGYYLDHDGDGGYGFFAEVSGGAVGFYIGNTGTGDSISITQSGNGNVMDITNSGTGATFLISKETSGNVFDITNSGTGYGIYLTHSNNSSSPLYINHTASATGNPSVDIRRTASAGACIYIEQDCNSANVASGIDIDIANAGAGLEYAFRFFGSEQGITSSGNGGFVSNSKGTFTLVGFIRVYAGGTHYVPYGTIA